MKNLKDVVLVSLLSINLLIGSVNLYLTLNASTTTDKIVNAHTFNSETMMLYFYDPNCDNCLETNEMIDTYIEFGYNQFIDIELIDITQDHSNILQQYQIVDYQINDVPAVVLLEKGKVIDSVLGIDQIFELLDTIVSITKTT